MDYPKYCPCCGHKISIDAFPWLNKGVGVWSCIYCALNGYFDETTVWWFLSGKVEVIRVV